MDEAIVELLSEISRRCKAEMRLAPGMGSRATPVQNELLACVARNPGIGVMKLSALMGRDKAQLVRLIAELEEQGLVARERSTLDRRSTKVLLTRAGEKAFEQVLKLRSALATAMLSPLTSEERQSLLSTLDKMRSGLAAFEQRH